MNVSSLRIRPFALTLILAPMLFFVGWASAETAITFAVSKDGSAVAEGASVSGIIKVTATVTDGVGQHAQFYGNFVVLPTDEAGHRVTSDPWVRTMTVDTSMFLDGENLVSVHSHPMNQPGQPYQTEFSVGTFKLLTANNKPAANGDTTLPELEISSFSATNGKIGMGVTVTDDGGNASLPNSESAGAANGQIICHLGSSVLGRSRWPIREFSDDRLVVNTFYANFQQQDARSARIVIFFQDTVGRANYAFKEFTIPALGDNVNRDNFPLPLMDARIMNLKQGDEVVIPDGGTFYLEVKVSNIVRGFAPGINLATWIGNRVINEVPLDSYIEDLDPSKSEFTVRVPIPADFIASSVLSRRSQESLGATAFALWNDLDIRPKTAISSSSMPTSTHIHLSSIRHASYGNPPVISSGPVAAKSTIQFPVSQTQLTVSATDNGLPQANLLYTWSVKQGGGVTFSMNGTSASHTTNATFSEPGIHVLSVSVYDGEFTTSGEVSVLVLPENTQSQLATNISELRFGETFTSFPKSLTLELINDGSVATTVSGIVFDDDVFSVEASLPLVVPPYQKKTIQFTYSPSGNGANSAAATILSDAAQGQGHSLTLALTGIGKQKNLIVQPGHVQATVGPGLETPRTLTLTNTSSRSQSWTLGSIGSVGQRISQIHMQDDVLGFNDDNGLAFDGTHFWSGTKNGNKLSLFDGNGALAGSGTYGYVHGLAFDGTHVVVSRSNNRSLYFNNLDGSFSHTFDFQNELSTYQTMGITFGDGALWVLDRFPETRILKIDPQSGTILSTTLMPVLDGSGKGDGFYLSWLNDSLWMGRRMFDGNTSLPSIIQKIDLAAQRLVKTIEVPYTIDGLTSDGKGGFWIMDRGRHACYLVSAGEHSWLELSPSSGVLAPGASVEVQATFKAGTFAAGTYTDKLPLVASDSFNPEAMVTFSMTVSASAGGNHPPILGDDVSASPRLGVVGDPVTFHVSATDADGDALTYTWDFGDNSMGTGSDPSHTYAISGNYQVSVIISDGQGSSMSDAVTFYVTSEKLANVSIEIKKDGVVVPVGGTVSGVVDVTFNITGGMHQGAVMYGNFVPLGHEHVPSNAHVITKTVDTREFYDGENLISIHVHPHNVSGQPYKINFRVGQFMVVTDNGLPAPNGDTKLPVLEQGAFEMEGNLIVNSVANIIDDGAYPAFRGTGRDAGAFEQPGGGQIIAHLGNSVMGRFSFIPQVWPVPFSGGLSGGQIIAGEKLVYFQREQPDTGRIVYFFSDSVGRANYGFRDIHIPAADPADRQVYPFPAADAKITNIAPGAEMVVPDGEDFIIKVEVSNVPKFDNYTFYTLTVWIANRLGNSIPLKPYIDALEAGQTSFVVDVPISSEVVKDIENFRSSANLGGTAYAIWANLNEKDRVPHTSASEHVHVRSLRTTAHPSGPLLTFKAWADPAIVNFPQQTQTNIFVVAKDNGFPNTQVIYTWSKIDGPGQVVFQNNGTVDSDATSATFSQSGSYKLQVAMYDGAFTNLTSVSVTVTSEAPAKRLGVDADAIDFGEVVVGTSVTRQLTLTNHGSLDTTVSAIQVNGTGFSIEAALPLTVSGFSSRVVTLTFSPDGQGERTGSVTVSSDAVTSLLSVVLKGAGGTLNNQAPIAQSDLVMVLGNAARSFQLVAEDPEGQSLQYTILEYPLHGELNGTAPALTYTPAAGYFGSDQMTFKVNDGNRDSNVARISFSAYALPRAGTIAAWGRNKKGQLGDGTTINHIVAAEVNTIENAKAVAAGAEHSVGLTTTGEVWTWGHNGSGRLGTGSLLDELNPVRISGLPEMVSIATLIDHTLACSADGHVYAWGSNFYGQLGNGTTSTGGQTTPLQVPGLTGVTVVQAGYFWSLVLKADGTVWSWGRNSYGQLGDNSTTQSSIPVQVMGLTNVTQIAAGSNHGLALKSDGTVWAWGKNNDNQLGDGTWNSRLTPIQVTGLPVIQAVSSGSAHNLVLDVNGSLWVWGNNAAGQLGFENPYRVSRPQQHPTLSSIADIFAGYSGSAVAKTDGTLWTFGSNSYGELGDGETLTYQKTPVLVVGVQGMTGVSMNRYHTLAVRASVRSSGPVIDSGPTAMPTEVLVGETVQFDVDATDPDSDPLTFTWDFKDGSAGTGASPTHAFAVAGVYSVSVTVMDGNGGMDSTTVLVTVTGGNSAPMAVADAVSTSEDSAITIAVLANDSDENGDALTVVSVTQPASGSVVNNGGSLTFTPAPNANGMVSFNYTISDGNGGSDSASVSVNVTAVNDVPVAVADAATTPEDSAISISVLGNDSDLEGDALTVSAVTQPASGSVANNGGRLTFTPVPDFNGSVNFNYTISDGNGGMDSASVSITVTAVNDAPVAVADVATTAEDTAITITVLGNDSDVDGDVLSISSVTQPSNGSVANNGGSITFTPAANFNGNVNFTYTLSDGQGALDSATVSVSVTAVNDLPVAVATSTTLSGEAPLAVTLDGSGSSDIEGALTYSWNFGDTQSGSGQTIAHSYQHAGDYTAVLTVTDSQGATAQASILIQVTEGAGVDPIAAYTGLRQQVGYNNNYTLGTRFSVSEAIVLKEIVIDGLLNGTSNNVALWVDGTTTPIATFSVTTGSSTGEVSKATDVEIAPGTYRLGGAFKSYRYTPVSELQVAPQVTVLGGVYTSGNTLAYPTNVITGNLYGHVNFKFVPADNSENVEPVALAAATPTDGEAPVDVSFDGSGSFDLDGSIMSYHWNFGDGKSAAGATAAHTYRFGGTYSATLTVTDNRGAQNSHSLTITVTDPPGGSEIKAYEGLRTQSGYTANYTLGTKFTTSTRIRLKSITVDGLLNGTSNNVAIYAEGNTTPLKTFSVTTGSATGEVSITVDVLLEAGTYRLVGAFKKYRYTPAAELSAAPHITVLGGVYASGASLQYPSSFYAGNIYGQMNFTYKVEE